MSSKIIIHKKKKAQNFQNEKPNVATPFSNNKTNLNIEQHLNAKKNATNLIMPVVKKILLFIFIWQ